MVLFLFSAGKNVKGLKHDISLFCQVWYSGSPMCVFMKNYPHASLFSEQKSVQTVVFLFFSPWMSSSRKKIRCNFLSDSLLPNYISDPSQKSIFLFPEKKEGRRKEGSKENALELRWPVYHTRSTELLYQFHTFVPSTWVTSPHTVSYPRPKFHLLTSFMSIQWSIAVTSLWNQRENMKFIVSPSRNQKEHTHECKEGSFNTFGRNTPRNLALEDPQNILFYTLFQIPASFKCFMNISNLIRRVIIK